MGAAGAVTGAPLVFTLFKRLSVLLLLPLLMNKVLQMHKMPITEANTHVPFSSTSVVC